MTGDSTRDLALPIDSAWLRRVQATEAFEDEWCGGRGCIATKLDLVPVDERRELLHELIKIDLEYRWRSGDRQIVENYAIEFPELGPSRELPIDLILEECRVRTDHGEPPSDAELESRFPSQATHVLSQLRCTSPAKGSLPRNLGRYSLRELIGRGGFAAVYRAWDPVLRREVAIKVVHEHYTSDAVTRARVEREARSVARLRHPAIVPILEIGHDGNQPFIVYELLPGPNLNQRLKASPVTSREAAAWTVRIAEALDYAHSQGVVHRDIKPSNILFDANQQPVLADFGLASNSDIEATLTQDGDVLGTPAYMSPEQALGQGHGVDGRSDVYGLGTVFYELLCRQPPFLGSAGSILRQVIHAEPATPRQVNQGIPRDLETICLKAIAKEPRRRYATAGALAADLKAFLESRPISAKRAGAITRLLLWSNRNRPFAAVIVVAVALVLLVTIGAFQQVISERNRYLAERKAAVANLYDSLTRESRAMRMARPTGYRTAVWKRLEQALALDTPARNPAVLRSEAVACLGDFVGFEPTVWTEYGKADDGHKDVITAMAFNRFSNTIAIGFFSGRILLQDRDGTIRCELPRHSHPVFAIACADGSDTIATMDDQGEIRVWRKDESAWKNIRTLHGPASGEPHLIVAVSCALTADGSQLISLAKGDSVVRLWDIATGEVAREFRGQGGQQFVRAALSTDSTLLAGAFRDPTMDGVVVWDVKTGTILAELPVTQQAIVDVNFNRDGKYLACACNNGTFVFETTNWQRRLWVHSDDQFFTTAFHPTLPWLAIPNSRKNVIVIWDVSTNEKVAELEHPGGPHSVLFAPDGDALLSATGHTIRSWNLTGGHERRMLAAHAGIVNRVVFRPDGRVMASAGHDGFVRLWDPRTGDCLASMRTVEDRVVNVSNIAFSRDGLELAAVDWSGNAVIFNVSDAEHPYAETVLLHGEFGEILWDVAASPDGKYWAVAAENGVCLWRERKLLPSPTSATAHAVAFDPRSSRLCWVSRRDGKVSIWDLRGERTVPVDLPPFPIGAAFVPDAGHLLNVGQWAENQPCGVIDVNTLQEKPLAPMLATFDASEARLTDYLVSPRGTSWGMEHEQAVLRELAHGTTILELPCNDAAIHIIGMSSDDRFLAIALTNGTIILWDITFVRKELGRVGLDW